MEGKEINIFLAGCGTVGGALLRQLAAGAEGIAERTGKHLRLVGLGNSRHYIINVSGLDPASSAKQLPCGCPSGHNGYIKALEGLRLPNSVFVDCTPSSEVASQYTTLFQCGYSVVSCNKIAFSAPYEEYKKMKDTAVRNGVGVRYETTVGAALPIIESVERCINCCDDIERIEAVLSGSLNYLFSEYSGAAGPSFATLVGQAQKLGYTEPDPDIDLNGCDVLRKILILSREAGIPLEKENVEKIPLPRKEDETSLRRLFDEAALQGCRLRYVATLTRTENGYKASTGLRAVDATHPFFNLNGPDNCAVITTRLYPSPLVIQGAGAGGAQTASGLLNDILKG